MKPFTTLAIAIFALIAIAHLYRLLVGLEVTIAGAALPQWVSLFGLALAGVLALMLWRESRLRA
jgi:hypothetical protein